MWRDLRLAQRIREGEMTSTRWGAVALVAFSVVALVGFVIEATPAFSGYDGDNPADMLRYLELQPLTYPIAGIVILVSAVLLATGVFATDDALPEGRHSTALVARVAVALGMLAAAFSVLHAVTRFSGGPILYMAALQKEWGEAAYLAVQMVGPHGAAQGAVLALCSWAVVV